MAWTCTGNLIIEKGTIVTEEVSVWFGDLKSKRIAVEVRDDLYREIRKVTLLKTCGDTS
jgi:hypothetical protein